jgi:hypothetical protein
LIFVKSSAAARPQSLAAWIRRWFALWFDAREAGEFMQVKQDVTIKTWDGTWTYHPKVLATPETVEDLVEIMVDTVRFPTPLRPAG